MKLVMTILLVLCSIILVILAIEYHPVFLIFAIGTALYSLFWYKSYELDKRVNINKVVECMSNLDYNDAKHYNDFIEFILNDNLDYAALAYELIKDKQNLYIPKVYEKYKNKRKIQ